MENMDAHANGQVSFADLMQALQQVGNPPEGTGHIQVMPTLMRQMTLHTGAERVQMFEAVDKEHFNRVFWYDAILDSSQNSRANAFPLSTYQQMQEAVMQRSIVVTPDVETMKERWPEDYRWLRDRNIHSVIAFPTLYEDHVTGFVALDNPDIERSRLFIEALPLIEAYLGSVRVNYQKQNRLELYSRLLRQKDGINQKKQGFLDVFCRDYTSIFYLDLRTDQLEVLKVEATANAAGMQGIQDGTPKCYSAMIGQYAEHYVIREQAAWFRQVMSVENITKELSDKQRVVYRYQSYPNMVGHQHFEVQIVRFSEEAYNAEAFIGFRHVDDLVSMEQTQREKLENTVEQLQASNEVLTALGRIYYTIFWIDLQKDVVEEVASDSDVHHLTGRRGRATAAMEQLCSKTTSEYRVRVQEFLDLSTLAQRLAEEETIAMEYLAIDGNWHTARFIVKRRGPEGQVLQVIFAARLISDVKRREKNWISIAQEANEANKAKTEFISQLAHDIRTPLNAIVGFTGLAQAHLHQPEVLQQDLAKIAGSERLLNDLVNNVLDLFRIEKGRLELHPEETNLPEFFARLQTSFEGEAAQKQLQLVFRVQNLPQDALLVDALRLTQICSNLLSNAIKYTQQGGTVELLAREEPAAASDRVRLVLAVRDNGIGMSEAYQKNMYAMFTRETDTRVNRVQGYGLGLSIVKQLTDSMGGTIDVQSQLGRGTQFTVTLELPVPQITAAAPQPDEGGKAADTAVCRGMRLLVAEDNDLNYEVVSALLEMHGITSVRAEDGAVCIEKFKAAAPGTYDAVLMDMQMPVMNGLQATLVLRNLDRPDARTVPILAMTANAFREDVENCLNVGMNAHLAKPLDMPLLLHTLAALCRR